MKKASAAFATPFLCGLLLVGIPTVSAQTDTITESFEGVDYFVDRFDGDDQPTFEVAFHNFDFTSTYVFDVNGFVTTIFADSQQYRMSYTNDKLSQIQMVALRRQLEEEQYAADRAEVVETAPASGVRRRLSKCDECHQTWDVVCDNGVDTVCDLKNFDKPFLSTGKVSVGGMCDDFGTLCNERTSEDVCEAQCGAVEPQPECQAPLTITLEYEYTGELEIASDASDVPNLELYVLEQGGQSAYWNNPTTDNGYLSATDNSQTYTMFGGLDADTTAGYYVAFVEWYGGPGPISWTATATTGSGDVLFSSEGEFTEDDCSSTTSSRMTAPFSEYIDNGC